MTSNRIESQAYVGLVAFIILIFSFIKFWRKGIANKFKNFPKPVLSIRVNDWIWAGTLVLLFSTAFPFTLGLQFLLDYIPGLKQFRSLGRFAWVFYYIIGVYAAYFTYIFYRSYRIKGKESTAIVVLTVILLAWGLEGFFYMNAMKQTYAKNSFLAEPNNLQNKLEAEGYITDEFQALLILPFYQFGSEKSHIDGYWKSFKTSAKYSLQLGMPLAQGSLSRTSISQTLKLTQVVAKPIVKREILADLPNEKPYLVLAYKGELNPDEQKLLKKGKIIGTYNKLTIYELPLHAFKHNYSQIWQNYKQGDLVENEGILTDKPTQSVYIDELEQNNSGLMFKGKERTKIEGDYLELYNEVLPHHNNIDSAEASVWVYADPEYSGYPTLRYYWSDEDVYYPLGEASPKHGTASTDGWVRIQLDFPYTKPEKIKFYLDGEGIRAASFMIRPKGIKVYQELEKAKTLNFNNYFID